MSSYSNHYNMAVILAAWHTNITLISAMK